MKSIGYAILAATALVMGCFAPDSTDRFFAGLFSAFCTVALIARKD